MSEFPCGCISGFFMCPETVRMWAEVRIYAPITTEENEHKYKDALNKYDAHFSEVQ